MPSNPAVTAALSQLGKPYAWAKPISADDPNPVAFDCSGLTMWSYKRAGITLAHFTGAQATQLAHRPLNQVGPGDLVFFGAGVPYHVGLYVGNGQIVEAPTAGVPVRLRVVDASTPDIQPYVGVYPGTQDGLPIVPVQTQATNPSGKPTNSLFGWTAYAGTITSWLGSASNWKRIGLFVLGAIVLLIAALDVLKGNMVKL